MEVIRAGTAGFCFGVDLALTKLDQLVDQVAGSAKIHTLGPIIHNPQVLERYARQGILQADSPEEIEAGEHVVIRAHGIPKDGLTVLKARDARIVDATCPRVKRAQLLIGRQSEKGKRLLLFGERDHPEVKGLLSHAEEDSVVFESLDKLMEMDLVNGREHFLAAQTTQDERAFEEVVDYLRSLMGDQLTVLHTICDATRRRQEEAIAVARQVEFMVVVGGLSSGNTRRLAKVVEAQGTPCLQVETADSLPLASLRRYDRIGLTAGASTPGYIIDRVQEVLDSL
jgi:4-hydroxy-3-methylbut-2-enyl diphosphate reductase